MSEQAYIPLKKHYYRIIEPNIDTHFECKLADVNVINVLSATSPIREGNIIILSDFDGRFKVIRREGNLVSIAPTK